MLRKKSRLHKYYSSIKATILPVEPSSVHCFTCDKDNGNTILIRYRVSESGDRLSMFKPYCTNCEERLYCPQEFSYETAKELRQKCKERYKKRAKIII